MDDIRFAIVETGENQIPVAWDVIQQRKMVGMIRWENLTRSYIFELRAGGGLLLQYSSDEILKFCATETRSRRACERSSRAVVPATLDLFEWRSI
jgi:hypothetical protein